MVIWGLILFVICQRFIELLIAKSNEKWMKKRGGIEVGESHYKWFIVLHILFFLAIIAEMIINNTSFDQTLNIYLLFLFIIAQMGRVWCIYSLGRFWNTKIITLPGVALIKKGPYKYIKHPNYFIVGMEFIIIPLLCRAWISAIIFPILHVLLLRVRIPAENKTLENKVIST